MNDLQKNSIFEKSLSPILQAGMVVGSVFLIIIVAKVIKLMNQDAVDDLFPWMITASFMLFFALANSFFVLTAKQLAKYWNQSILAFFLSLIICGLLAYLFSGISIGDAGSYRWIYIVVSVGYLVFLSLMTFVRTIVEFAMKEEWNQPRARRKRKKS